MRLLDLSGQSVTLLPTTPWTPPAMDPASLLHLFHLQAAYILHLSVYLLRLQATRQHHFFYS